MFRIERVVIRGYPLFFTVLFNEVVARNKFVTLSKLLKVPLFNLAKMCYDKAG